MEAKIFKAIITCNRSFSDELDLVIGHSENYVLLLQDDTIKEISKLLTKLLSYKISKEAYQRYASNLRDWSRMKGNIGCLPVFRDIERSYKILLSLFKKYLTSETLSACDNTENLIKTGKILLLLLHRDKSIMHNLERVVKQIINLDKTHESIEFCKSIVCNKDVNSDILQMIYVYGKEELIENPITDCFVKYCSNQNDSMLFSKLNTLLIHILWNSRLFTILSFKMKEIFLESEYSQLSQDFIQCVLKKIEENCKLFKKDMVEIYPICLQPTVTFFRLKENSKCFSKDYAKKLLTELYLNNSDYAEVIVSQFSEWLPVYLEILKTVEEEDSSDEPT